MATGKILVTAEILREASNKVAELTRKYHDDYTTIYNHVNAIAEGASWGGKDHEAFVEQIEQFRDDFDSMEQEMMNYSEFLKKTADAYSLTQKNITEDVARTLTNSW